MSALAELFPDGDYRFHLTLRRGEPRDFFAPRDASGRVLAERARWLAAEPARCAQLLPEGRDLFAEFAARLAEWKVVSRRVSSLGELGARLEPDVLLLSPDDAGQFRLRGGALCFPTGWTLDEKLGQPLAAIHGVVPGLNAALGPSIAQVLARLKPGVALLRDNWGLAATDELNLHPARGLPAPRPPLALERLWLRVEHQALIALPRTRGIVFGIRIALHRLDDVARDVAAPRLRHALATMPAEVAAYKRIERIRSALVEML